MPNPENICFLFIFLLPKYLLFFFLLLKYLLSLFLSSTEIFVFFFSIFYRNICFLFFLSSIEISAFFVSFFYRNICFILLCSSHFHLSPLPATPKSSKYGLFVYINLPSRVSCLLGLMVIVGMLTLFRKPV